MSGYSVVTTTHRIGAVDFQIRSLSDRRQYWDPDGSAERAGISSAAWPIFGVVWPAGVALAEEMSGIDFTGMKILEIGCGIALASLVLQQRGANITASDHHPLAEEFLRRNAELNGLAPIPFHHAPWADANPELGRFDLIIGSDLLYERGHPALLSTFVGRHSKALSRVILADPGRARCGQFSTKMSAAGYQRTDTQRRFASADETTPSGRLMNFTRGTPSIG